MLVNASVSIMNNSERLCLGELRIILVTPMAQTGAENQSLQE